MSNVPAWFERYIQRGFRLIPYQPKTKGPTGLAAVNWPAKFLDRSDQYQADTNYGALLGVEIEPGRFLVDVDFDWNEGLVLSRKLLPSTAFAFGRGDRKVTHAFYTADTPLPSYRYDDVSGKCLVELRCAKRNGSLGLQTMLPPSVHPSGEVITFAIDKEISHASDIDRRVALYAVACALLYNLGAKSLTHDIRLALAGFLLQNGLNEEETLAVCEAVAEATGNDVSDVRLTVESTAQRVAAREPVKGKAVLLTALGDKGKQLLARIREWLGGGEWITDPKTDVIMKNDQENIRRALSRLQVHLTFDVFRMQPMIKTAHYEGLYQDPQRNDLWLEIHKQFKFLPSPDIFDVVLDVIARENSFHPVVDYLDSVVWDRIPRLDTWLIDHGGAADTEYTRSISSIVLIAAVRRARDKSGYGVKFDELIVLESSQGLFKSSALRALCPDEDWFSDDVPLDVDAKQLIERTVGKWIIEAAELAGMRQSQVESLKAMLSRQKDGPVRMAYGRIPIQRPRGFIFIGTTNSDAYLKDSTGNRRFWPVRVKSFNVEALRANRDQLWAEASVREAAGESIRLRKELYGTATLQQERRRAEDPWEVRLGERFERDKRWKLSPDEVWEAVGVSIERRDERGNERLLRAMTHLGFRRGTVTVKDDEGKDTGKRVKGFVREIVEGQSDLPWEQEHK